MADPLPASPTPVPLSRRAFLRATVAFGGGALVSGLAPPLRPAGAAPGLVRQGRPTITHGVQSGDVTDRSAVVWARADRPGRLWVEVSGNESFRRARRVAGPWGTEETDFTAQAELHGLPSGEDVFYRVWFESDGLLGETAVGHLRTAPRHRRHDVSFVWSGDTAGQGWGINPDIGGMRTYETMRETGPDFFIHCGDTIYADGPVQSRVTLPDGSVWRNVTTEEKSKVAETLDEFRGNYKYNLLDANIGRFNAEVPLLAQWDDHETLNNWYPGEVLTDPRYEVRDVDVLARRARQAFHEFMPVREQQSDDGRIYRVVRYGPLLDVFLLDMRTYRGPNTANDQPLPGPETDLLGRRQLDWLKRRLLTSRATWKAIASDMPIGLVVPDGSGAFEAVANADTGGPRGRELEVAELLSFIQHRGVANVVWFTADVHYTAAHRYDPSQAAFVDFTPFWEFVSGPLHAGTFGPASLDRTFGPVVEYQKVPPTPNLPTLRGDAVLRPRPHQGLHRGDDRDIEGHERRRPVQGGARADRSSLDGVDHLGPPRRHTSIPARWSAS